MALQTHSAAAALLKRKYGPGIQDQLQNETIALGMLQRIGKEKWGGSAFFHSLRTGRNRSMRPGGESTALPTAQRQAYTNAQIGCRIYHGVGGFTEFGAAATQGSDAAFGEMVETEVNGLIADARKDLNIDVYGTPLGVLARINGAHGVVATVNLHQAQALDPFNTYGNRYLSPNMLIDIVDQQNGTVHSAGLTVASVASANRTQVTFTGNIADPIDDGDLLVRSGTQTTAAAAARAFDGLEMLIDDTTTMPADATAMGFDLDTLEGISRSTLDGDGNPNNNEYWRGNVMDLAGAALSETHLQNIVYLSEERGGLYPDVFLTHRSVQYAIQQLMVGDRRFVPQEFPGGFKAVSLVYNAGDMDIPVVVDRECPYDRLYALNLDCLHMYVLRDVELIENDGSVLRQASSNGDEWEFAIRLFGNLGTTQPNALGKLVRIGGADEAFGIGAARVYDF